MTVEPNSQPNEQPNQPPELVLAKWSTRFWAWLVDVIIVNVGLGVLFAVVSLPMWLYGFANPKMMAPINGTEWWNGFGPFGYAITSLVFFVYWTYMESRNGQSIGKMLLHIKTTNLEGKQADVKSIAISSFGKSFLVVIDVLLGWIFTNEKRQRLLAKAANTVVIKVQDLATGNVSYRKD